jgi:hypothetical protein
MNRLISGLVTLAAIAAATICDGAPIISGFAKLGGNASPLQLLQGGIEEGQALYSDSPAIMLNVPLGLIGGDVLQTSSTDGGSQLIDVTLQNTGLLYLAIEDAHTQPFAWMGNNGFTDLIMPFINTGDSIVIDTNADLVGDGTMSLWAALATPGTYHLGAGPGLFNYAIMASYSLPDAPPVIVDEANAFTLAAIGGICALGMIRNAKRGKE